MFVGGGWDSNPRLVNFVARDGDKKHRRPLHQAHPYESCDGRLNKAALSLRAEIISGDLSKMEPVFSRYSKY